ncbi:MAG: hypothetical protein IPP73_00655 [Chitinophagaceae bacterium]|nr:hypothetical protein [Chitinophagaceae bacterium]
MIKSPLYIIISFLLLSCGNNHSGDKNEPGSDRYPTPPDSLSKALLPGIADRDFIYDSLARRFPERKREFILIRTSVDHYLQFTGNLKSDFYLVCGDKTGQTIPIISEDSIDLTNRFFIQSRNSAALYSQIQKARNFMQPYCTDSVQRSISKKLEPVSDEKTFTDLYFMDIPPVAVITIINSFDYKVKELEESILSSLLNSK